MKPARETSATVRTVLLDAAEAIRARGWCQGAPVAPGGELCLIGAVMEASGSSGAPISFSHPCWQALERLGRAVPQPVTWNDAPGRTAADVIALLEKVALDG
jgi:hypothetical protein